MSVDSYSWATERNSCFLIAQSVDGSIVAYGYLPVAAGKIEDHEFLTLTLPLKIGRGKVN